MLALLRADPETSEEEHVRLLLVAAEMERAKYVVRSYVRARLHKVGPVLWLQSPLPSPPFPEPRVSLGQLTHAQVEKYAHHVQDSPALSGAERQHARRYAALVDAHFGASVLDSLPPWLRRTDDTGNDGVSMVARPDGRNLVLVHCRQDCGEVPLEGGRTALLAAGSTHILQWDAVSRWVGLGWAEVL